MNDPLESFWVFTFLALGFSSVILNGATTLCHQRHSWAWRILAKRFYMQAGILLIVVITALMFVPAASIEDIGPYPYLKVFGFNVFIATLKSVTSLAKEVNEVDGCH